MNDDPYADALDEIVEALAERRTPVSDPVLKGALTGFVAAGPVGALVGAGAGAIGASAGPVGSSAPGTGAVGSSAPAGQPFNPAALQLLASLLRPEVIYALAA